MITTDIPLGSFDFKEKLVEYSRQGAKTAPSLPRATICAENRG